MPSHRSFAAKLVCIATAALVAVSASPVHARTKLESICSISGQTEIRLVGMGLVTGLKGTGDGGKFLPMISALGMALRKLNSAALSPTELKDTTNVALVLIEATIPANGIRRGQRIDCFVNSIGAAKSLKGGRLMVTPLGSEIIDDERVMGLASGAVLIEDASVATAGRIAGGVVVTEDVINDFVKNNQFVLLLDKDHATFRSASEVAQAVNRDTSFEASGEPVARADSPGVITVRIPKQYGGNQMQFIAQVLDVGIDNPHTQARVVLNAKAGTVVVTGEVEISPVAISHKNLTLTIGTDDQAGQAAEPVPGVGFVSLMDQQTRQSPQKLNQLISALNQLKVPTADVIDILKELHRSGKLHAELITE